VKLSRSRIVVFDTGTGGELFAKALAAAIPTIDVVTVIDTENSPYGNKKSDTIRRLVEHNLKPYLGKVRMIAIACNTATANAIEYLREKYPEQFFVGFEPAVKPAGEQSKTRKVMVLATNATLKSARYQRLCNKYCISRGVDVYEPDCRKWAKKIDDGTITKQDVEKVLKPYIGQNFDFVALACTHFVAIRPWIEELVGPGVTVYNTTPAIIRYIKSQL
jgi:glutamate racemase